MTPAEATMQLFAASESGNVQLAREALAAGAEVHAGDNNQWTPLHWAGQYSHTEVARLLIENGARVNARGRDQRMPLHWAAISGHTDVARLVRFAT